APARHCELAYVSPDRDVFRPIEADEAWRGEIPPTRLSQPEQIVYCLMPLREGVYTLPELEVAYDAEEGRREVARSARPLKIPVTFNYDLPLTGREEERRTLTELLAGRAAAFALIEGEAGSGRSRLLDEIGAWLRDEGWLTFHGKSLERAREPMKIFHDVARRIFGIGREPLSGAALMARVIDRLAPLAGEDPGMAGYFAAFLSGAEMPEAQASIQGYLWFRLLGALARDAPVALLLDDLQWSTQESIDLAETLVRRAREEGVPLAVVGATLSTDPEEKTRSRISHLKDRFSSLATNPGLARRVKLTALDAEEDVHALLDHVFPGSTLAEDHPWLVPALISQSGGNPFHLLQILRLLREARDEAGEPLISAEGGAWTLRPELDEARIKEWVPEAVEDMVRALIQPLEPEVREVLTIAAIVGEEFDVSFLEALADGSGNLDRGLEVLEQADLIRATDEAGERYRFTSSLVRVIVEREVREGSRRAHARLHREVARTLESTLGSRGLKRAALLYARHLLLAGDREKALRWHVIAAEGLVRQQLYLRADALLSIAGRLLEEDVPAGKNVLGRYHFLRGEVFRVTGRLREAQAALDQAVEHFGGARGQADLARALSKIGKVHETRGEIDRASYCFQLGAQIREDIGDTAALAHSRNNLGSLHLLKGDEEEARKAFEDARSIASGSGNAVALGNALSNLAALSARRGEWEEAEALYRESLSLGESKGDRLGVAQSLNGLGTVAFRRGDVEGARGHYERAIEIRREVGDREGAANILSNLGVIHDRQGDYEAALDYYRRSVEGHRAVGSRRGLATVLNNIGVVNLARGDVSRAVMRFEEAVRIRREMGDRERIGTALHNLGEAYTLAGRAEEARAGLDQAHDAFKMVGDPRGCASVHSTRAALARREGDLDRALGEIRTAVKHRVRDPTVRSQLHLELSKILLARSEIENAARAADRAMQLAAEGEDRMGTAQALRLVATTRRAGGDTEGAWEPLRQAESLLRGTSGPELMRVYLEQGLALRDADPARAREFVMRARGLLDALDARGAVLPERARLEELLGDEESTR
ncbi:MAG: tetratricopeptide repeat protein, partial [Planctomycetota bacterium]